MLVWKKELSQDALGQNKQQQKKNRACIVCKHESIVKSHNMHTALNIK